MKKIDSFKNVEILHTRTHTHTHTHTGILVNKKIKNKIYSETEI